MSNRTMSLTFSPDFSTPDCPLPSANYCDGAVFVLVQDLSLDPIQFQSQAERGRAIGAVGDKACTRHGLSVFPSYDACMHQRRLFPRLGNYVASAVLRAEHGKVADTPSQNPAHQTWWPYQEVVRHELFSVVEAR